MKTAPSRPRSHSGIEPLEARIAPATILVGSLGTAGTTDYNTVAVDAKTPVFFNTLNPAGSVDTSTVGGDADTYYIKLTAGDQIQQFGNGGFTPLLTVTKGTVVAFFVDGGTKLQVDQGELSGLSLGAGAAIELNTGLDGSVLSNYDAKANAILMTSLGGPKQSIAGVDIGGTVTGGIYAGGAIANVDVKGGVTEIFTGLAADTIAFDLLRGAANGGDGVLAITAAPGEAGGNISTVEVRSITSLIAGGGGDGGKGGLINNVKILEDNDDITIRAGAGGKSVAGKSGGIGGDVSNIFVSGTADPTSESIKILAGDGGSAVANSGGKGGAGGKALNVFVGFDAVSGKPTPSAGQLIAQVEIAGGLGGSAKMAGKGGDVVNVKVLTQTANSAPPNTYEVSVHAGNGGVPNDALGGLGGAGGAVNGAEVQNQNFDVGVAADVLISAGDAGGGNLNAKGANGGAATKVSVLGFKADVFAGDGSDGIAGGNGGALTGLTFLSQDIILPNNINVSAGTGGDGSNGNGGKGGDLKTLKMANSNFKSFRVNTDNTLQTAVPVNTGVGGDGGKSIKGKGGNAGVVSGLDLVDGGNGTGPEFPGELIIRSGKGGDGDKGGGAGGEISLVTFFGQDLGAKLDAGDGGNATLDGKGGAGGKLRSVNLSSDGLFNGVQVHGFVESGLGGAGAGKGNGGNGGDVSFLNINFAGNVEVHASSGGAGAGVGGGGNGGSLIAVGAFARDGFGELIAGDAGAGAKAAKGGSIAGTKSQLVGLRAAESLEVRAGNGTGGGDGGAVSGLAFGSSSPVLRPLPEGNILIQAGNGSAGGKIAGKGGSILNVSGSSSSGLGTSTQILAGVGAGIAAKGGDGGSISEVLLSGAGDDGVDGNAVEIVFQAGDAGDSAGASKGAKGGQIKNLSLNNLDPDAILRSVAAGNGGDADLVKGTGGLGGTIDGVRVIGGIDPFTLQKLSGDIGYKTGKVYGFASMGGLFAGTAGAGFKEAIAGSVRNVSADSIAAIVAGRDDAPAAAEKVEKIYLNDLSALKVAENSPFTVSYPGAGSTSLLTLNDPLTVQTAINNLLAPPAPANVSVIRTSGTTFLITNQVFGDIDQYVGEEYLQRDVVETVSGEQELLVNESIAGTLVSPETQSYVPKDNGTYEVSYLGDPPVTLNFNDPAAVVQAALNNIANTAIAAAGGVVVTGDPVAGFDVKFNNNGVRALLAITADLSEVQRIDTLGVGEFEIATGFGTTGRLAANASALDVQNAINGLAGPQVTVAADPADATAYVVTFVTTGEQVGFSVTEFAPLAAATVTPGGAAVKEVQSLNFVPRNAFSSADFAAANLVGAIVDPNEIGSGVFKFTPVGAPHVGFQLGDKPIDGLIVTKVLDQATINFTPEAALIGGVFFDNDNKI